MSNNIYGKIYLEHRNKVYYRCLRKLNNHADAEDCTQEVFLLLFKKRIDINDNYIGWLYKTADYIVQNYIRKNRNRSLTEKSAFVNDTDPYNDLDTDITLKKILSDTEYKLLTERYLTGKTVEELAKELNISAPSVYRKLALAKTKAKYLYNLDKDTLKM